MTKEQLRFLRDQRGLTREQLAAELGDCTASTINKWERGMHAIPEWVADKMLRKMPITFSIEELAEMYDLCRREHFSFSEMIQEAVKDLIQKHRPKAATYLYTTGGGGSHDISQVAEEHNKRSED